MDYFITATAYGLNNNSAELTVCLGLFLSYSNTATGLIRTDQFPVCNLIQYT